MNQNKLEKAIRKGVEELLEEKRYVSTVDLLVKLNYLSEEDCKKWRFGKIEFLEKVFDSLFMQYRICERMNMPTLDKFFRTLFIFTVMELEIRGSWCSQNNYEPQYFS